MTDRLARRRQQKPKKLELESCMTRQEIAAELGVSAERVRVLELQALRKLRQALEERGFSAVDFLD